MTSSNGMATCTKALLKHGPSSRLVKLTTTPDWSWSRLVGKVAKTDNVLMKDTVIPKLKVMTAREIEEEERLMEKLKDNHKKVIGKLYSSKSGVKYNDDLTPDMLHRKSTADKKTKKKKDSRD